MKSKNYSENIIKVFKKDGFVLSEPDVLLDSDYIIQRSGENFRKLMFTFEDDTGKSMCLRPDLTVASCIKYLKGNSKVNSKIFYSVRVLQPLFSIQIPFHFEEKLLCITCMTPKMVYSLLMDHIIFPRCNSFCINIKFI